jgi:hypothetical protein
LEKWVATKQNKEQERLPKKETLQQMNERCIKTNPDHPMGMQQKLQ